MELKLTFRKQHGQNAFSRFTNYHMPHPAALLHTGAKVFILL